MGTNACFFHKCWIFLFLHYCMWDGDKTVMVGVYEKDPSHVFKSLLWRDERRSWYNSLALAFTTAASERERIIFPSCMHVFDSFYLPLLIPITRTCFLCLLCLKMSAWWPASDRQKHAAWGLHSAMGAKVTQAEDPTERLAAKPHQTGQGLFGQGARWQVCIPWYLP